jgi:hypothetical protein
MDGDEQGKDAELKTILTPTMVSGQWSVVSTVLRQSDAVVLICTPTRCGTVIEIIE